MWRKEAVETVLNVLGMPADKVDQGTLDDLDAWLDGFYEETFDYGYDSGYSDYSYAYDEGFSAGYDEAKAENESA